MKTHLFSFDCSPTSTQRAQNLLSNVTDFFEDSIEETVKGVVFFFFFLFYQFVNELHSFLNP